MARLQFFPKVPAKTSGLFIGRHIEPMSFQQMVCSVFFFFSFVGEFPWNEDINELDEKQCCKYFNPFLCSLNKNVTGQRCSCHNSTESDWLWAYALIFFDRDFKCRKMLHEMHGDCVAGRLNNLINSPVSCRSFSLIFSPHIFWQKTQAATSWRHAWKNKHSQKVAVINRTSDTKVFAL